MSQVLGAFGLLDFTMLQLVLAWRAFWNLWTVYFFNFPFFFGPPWTADKGACLYCIFLKRDTTVIELAMRRLWNILHITFCTPQWVVLEVMCVCVCGGGGDLQELIFWPTLMRMSCALGEGARTHVNSLHHLSVLFYRHPKQLQNVETSHVFEITSTVCNFAIFQDFALFSCSKIWVIHSLFTFNYKRIYFWDYEFRRHLVGHSIMWNIIYNAAVNGCDLLN